MRNLFENAIVVVLSFVTAVFFASIMTGCSITDKVEAFYEDEYVIEEFIIDIVDGDEVYGYLVESTENLTCEGIYLDNTIYEIFPNLRKIELGMRIKVVYDKDDYYNNIWDNIIDIEILSEDSL